MSEQTENHKTAIEDELRVWEGEGPPGQSELAGHAIYQLEGLLDEVDELRDTGLVGYQEDVASWIEESALEALVAMEMHEGHRGGDIYEQ